MSDELDGEGVLLRAVLAAGNPGCLKIQTILNGWEDVNGWCRGGPAGGVVHFLAGAKRHRQEPWAYLRDVVLRLCAGETDLESLLPDRWAASRPEHVLQHHLDESRRQESRQKARAAGASRDGRADRVRATDAAVEDRPGIGEGGRPLLARGAERRDRPLGIRPLDRRSRLGGPCADTTIDRRAVRHPESASQSRRRTRRAGRVSRPRPEPDRRSPGGLRPARGDLRSARWPGRETSPQRPATSQCKCEAP